MTCIPFEMKSTSYSKANLLMETVPQWADWVPSFFVEKNIILRAERTDELVTNISSSAHNVPTIFGRTKNHHLEESVLCQPKQ